MIMRMFFVAVFNLLSVIALTQSNVYLIPTLHQLHQANSRYNYDSLRSIVARIKPDVIAVQIRSEDIKEDSAYLKQHYPYEMWMMKYWFPAPELRGFDWLGNDIAGKRMPDNYRKDQSPVKRMETLLSIDTAMKNKVAACQLYAEQRKGILQSGSLKDIYNSPDAILARTYFDCLRGQLQGTGYATLTEYRNHRIRMMQQQVDSIINQYADKTIVILTGADDYPFVLESLRKSGVAVQQPGTNRSLSNNKKSS